MDFDFKVLVQKFYVFFIITMKVKMPKIYSRVSSSYKYISCWYSIISKDTLKLEKGATSYVKHDL